MINDYKELVKILQNIEDVAGDGIIDSGIKIKEAEKDIKIQKLIKELIRAIKIDWRDMKDKLENWEKTNKVPQSSYEEIFLYYWLDEIPGSARDLFLDINEEIKKANFIFQDSVGATILKDVRLLGASIYQVRNTNFCASTAIPPTPCKECYFCKICKITF